MELAAGTLVTENVRLVEPLGEGGMGSLWIADHAGLRTRVAVKFIAQELLVGSPDIVKRFSREATAAAQIRSPHVVQTLDHGVMEDGRPYIVMELLEGESLAERLKRDTTLPLPQVAEILKQTSKGLGKAHAAGIIHRDIKPDNIFLVGGEDDEIYVKLLDFGVAKHTDSNQYNALTSTGTMLGTPGYMSPEQVLTGKGVDLRSDLWSLAVVTYHAMIGDIPFQGETLGALCVAISSGEFTPPSQLRPEIPAAVDQWMLRALDLDREERFQSTKELADTFRAALARPSMRPSTASGLPGEGPTVRIPSPLREPPPMDDDTLRSEAFTPLAERETAAPSHPQAHEVPEPAPPGRSSRPLALIVGISALSFVIGFAAVLAFTMSSSSTTSTPAASAAASAEQPPETQTGWKDETTSQTDEAAHENETSAAASAEQPPEPATTVTVKAEIRPAPTPRPRPRPTPRPRPRPTPQPNKDRGF